MTADLVREAFTLWGRVLDALKASGARFDVQYNELTGGNSRLHALEEQAWRRYMRRKVAWEATQ